jgi:hypothetical protein
VSPSVEAGGDRPGDRCRAASAVVPADVPVQPLPDGTPGRAKASDLGVKENSPLTFFVVGDHGGIKDPNPQNAVTFAMEAQPLPAFVYSVGDVVYFNADAPEWHPQFYEAYAHVAVPCTAAAAGDRHTQPRPDDACPRPRRGRRVPNANRASQASG